MRKPMPRQNEPMKLTDFHVFHSREINGLPWQLLGEARSIDYRSHHVMLKLWGTDQATNTVFNLQMEISKYWVPPSQKKKEFPRARVVPVATWDEHFPEEKFSPHAVARFHQLKKFVGNLFDSVVWSMENDPEPRYSDDETDQF